jgi:predicted DNA-binding protein
MNSSTKPIPVRLDALTKSRLHRAAKRLGSTRSGVIRFSILNLLPQIEAGVVVLNAEPKEQV